MYDYTQQVPFVITVLDEPNLDEITHAILDINGFSALLRKHIRKPDVVISLARDLAQGQPTKQTVFFPGLATMKTDGFDEEPTPGVVVPNRGYYTLAKVAKHLRTHSNKPETVQYIAEMLEE